MGVTKKDATLTARVVFISPENGGRKLPLSAWGYRGHFFYDDRDCDAFHMFEPAVGHEPFVNDKVPLGEEVLDHLILVNPEHHRQVYEGMPFLIREGFSTIGYGQVLKVHVNARAQDETLPEPSTWYAISDADHTVVRCAHCHHNIELTPFLDHHPCICPQCQVECCYLDWKQRKIQIVMQSAPAALAQAIRWAQDNLDELEYVELLVDLQTLWEEASKLDAAPF